MTCRVQQQQICNAYTAYFNECCYCFELLPGNIYCNTTTIEVHQRQVKYFWRRCRWRRSEKKGDSEKDSESDRSQRQLQFQNYLYIYVYVCVRFISSPCSIVVDYRVSLANRQSNGLFAKFKTVKPLKQVSQLLALIR